MYAIFNVTHIEYVSQRVKTNQYAYFMLYMRWSSVQKEDEQKD